MCPLSSLNWLRRVVLWAAKETITHSLIVPADSVLFLLVERANRNTTVLGDESDKLLADVLEIVVLP